LNLQEKSKSAGSETFLGSTSASIDVFGSVNFEVEKASANQSRERNVSGPGHLGSK
jgi:hypothetical protein